LTNTDTFCTLYKFELIDECKRTQLFTDAQAYNDLSELYTQLGSVTFWPFCICK